MAVAPKKNRMLIKLSGEALSDGPQKYSEAVLSDVATKIKALLEQDKQICLVIGGGNLFRGAELSGTLDIKRPTADYIGMIATVQNALVVRDYFHSQGVDARVLSAISMNQVCEPYVPGRAIRHMEKGRVVIFAGGLGNPFFTTDSASAQRALEMNCSLLVMAKNGVDAVYTKDPRTNPDAEKITEIKGSDVLEQNLKVVDGSAISVARDNGLPIHIISMNDLEHIGDQSVGTVVTPE